jgi:hypothetical protein
MIEFVIAILLVVIILAGFFQFFDIAMKRGELLEPLRADAGRKAMGVSHAASQPDYIVSWEEGDDEERHTADDKKRQGSAATTLGAGIVEHSVSDGGQWQYTEGFDSALPDLRGGISAPALGFTREDHYANVTLLPIMRNWIIGKDNIRVGGELWFPSMSISGAGQDGGDEP